MLLAANCEEIDHGFSLLDPGRSLIIGFGSLFWLSVQTRGKETHQLGAVARLCGAPGVVAPGGQSRRILPAGP